MLFKERFSLANFRHVVFDILVLFCSFLALVLVNCDTAYVLRINVQRVLDGFESFLTEIGRDFFFLPS